MHYLHLLFTDSYHSVITVLSQQCVTTAIYRMDNIMTISLHIDNRTIYNRCYSQNYATMCVFSLVVF